VETVCSPVFVPGGSVVAHIGSFAAAYFCFDSRTIA
jgi:hypothetical protein